MIRKLDYKNLDLYHTLISGQTFEWFLDIENNQWNGIIQGEPLILKQIGNKKEGYLEYESEYNRDEHISRYFGLDEEYDELIDKISFDPNVKILLEKLYGLRIIQQDPWFCINSFILSSNNTVKNIQNILRNISIKADNNNLNKNYYNFPSYDQVKILTEQDFRDCKAGFRAKFLIDFYNKISLEKDFMESIIPLSYEEGKQKLITVKGIGEKVADCILLYAYKKYEAYPVDTHLRKATHECYFPEFEKPPSDKMLREWAKEYWGNMAGFAHFFLFTYRRMYGKIKI